MIFEHKKTKDRYRLLGHAWDVDRQGTVCIYVSMKNGVMFTQDKELFAEKFEFIDNFQFKLTPKDDPQLRLFKEETVTTEEDVTDNGGADDDECTACQ
jgi:hypothetical protein